MKSDLEARLTLVQTVAKLNEQVESKEITVDEYETALTAAIKEYKHHV